MNNATAIFKNQLERWYKTSAHDMEINLNVFVDSCLIPFWQTANHCNFLAQLPCSHLCQVDLYTDEDINETLRMSPKHVKWAHSHENEDESVTVCGFLLQPKELRNHAIDYALKVLDKKREGTLDNKFINEVHIY